MAELNLDMQDLANTCLVGYSRDNDYVLTSVGEGTAVGEAPIGTRHLNPHGTVHGGVVFALADTIGGIAARTLGAWPTTCSSTINYMRPTMGVQKLVAEAAVLKRGKNTIVVDVAVRDENGVEVSHVLATYFDLNKN